jgi:hypothetical protein
MMAFVPRFRQVGFVGGAVEKRPAPLRPIGGGAPAGGQQENRKNSPGDSRFHWHVCSVAFGAPIENKI